MNTFDILLHPFFVPFLIQFIVAYEWIKAGGEKILSGTFPGSMSKTLDYFISKNPHAWYADTVLHAAKNSPELFAQLVQWGELLTGVGLIMSIVLWFFTERTMTAYASLGIAVFSFAVAAFMSAHFYLAAGWTSPSTHGLNALLFWIEIILLANWMLVLKKRV